MDAVSREAPVFQDISAKFWIGPEQPSHYLRQIMGDDTPPHRLTIATLKFERDPARDWRAILLVFIDAAHKPAEGENVEIMVRE